MSTLFQDDHTTSPTQSIISRTNMSIDTSKSGSGANAVPSKGRIEADSRWNANLLSWDENSTETAIQLSDYYSIPLKRDGLELHFGQSTTGYDDLPHPRNVNHLQSLEPAPEDKSQFSLDRLIGPRKELNPKHHEADWGFLKEAFELTPDPSNSTCPSLVSGSTMSSRNSSTRSTRLFFRNSMERRESSAEPMPELPASIAKQQDPLESCPVQTCNYFVKGFASSTDKVRHIITHFKGIMVCGFCPRAGMAGKKTFNSVDLFLEHLVNTHRVKQKDLQPELSRNDSCRKSKSRNSVHSLVATCSICSEPFDAQGFYEHLPGCVLRQIMGSMKDSVKNAGNVIVDVIQCQDSKNSPRNDSVVTPVEAGQLPVNPPDRNRRPSAMMVASAQAQELSLELMKVARRSPDIEIESKEIEELTASSRCLSLTSSKAADSSGDETDWTEDTHSRESTPESPQLQRRLTPMKRRLVDTIMQEFHRLLDKSLRTQAGEGSSNSAQGVYHGSSSNSSTYSSSSFVSRKRSLSGGGATPPNDEDDSHKRRRSDPRGGGGGGKQPLPEVRFACPYYKRNPGRHQTFTSCRDPGFITVARLKEHLYRRHLLPPQCNRCCTTFVNDPALREHQRDPRGCEVREQIPLEGFDKDQERKLKSKKRSLVAQSEEDKWKGVYKILFPDDGEDGMPSPYIEYQPCTGQQAEPSNVVRFQEFSRLELPRLVRRTLEVVVEQEAQPLEEKLKERLIDVVQECQARLITMFQASAGPSLDSSEILEQQQQANVIPRKVSTTSTRDLSLPTPAPELPQLEDFINIPFDDFDSLHTTTTTTAHILSSVPPPLDPSLYTPQKPCTSPVENTSGSPDSGYDSAWTSAASSHPHLPNFNPDMSFPPANSNSFNDTNNTHVDLGGYYGLFENRSLSLDPATSMVTAAAPPEHATELNANDWSFMDPAQLNGVGGAAAGGRYHSAGDIQWGYQM